ncbi:hypothetical protein ES703_68207 [subsurface metagenome]
MSVKVDLNYTIKNLDGKDVKDIIIDEDEKGKIKTDKEGNPSLKRGPSITLRKVCAESLVNPPPVIDPLTKRPKEIPADKKIDAWNFAQRIHAAKGLMELTSDEITELKKLINKRYSSGLNYIAIVAQAHAVLDPTSDKKS